MKQIDMTLHHVDLQTLKYHKNLLTMFTLP